MKTFRLHFKVQGVFFNAHMGRDILAALKNLVRGEVRQYADLLTSVRDSALDDMVKEAQALGANAIIGVRFASSQVAEGMAEILVYGTRRAPYIFFFCFTCTYYRMKMAEMLKGDTSPVFCICNYSAVFCCSFLLKKTAHANRLSWNCTGLASAFRLVVLVISTCCKR